MSYIKLTNGVPEIYSIGQLRRDNPNTSFPKNIPEALLAAYDVYPCKQEAGGPPAHNPMTQDVTQEFTQLHGEWAQVWVVKEKSQADKDAAKALWRSSAVLSRAQFCTRAFRAGLLPKADAIAAAKGEWPPSFDAALAGLPEDVKTEAQIEWAAVNEIRRDASTLAVVQAAENIDEAHIDALFGWKET